MSGEYVGQLKRVCPVCKEQQAVTHCANDKSCFWLRCKSKRCGVVVDLRRRRAVNPAGEISTF